MSINKKLPIIIISLILVAVITAGFYTTKKATDIITTQTKKEMLSATKFSEELLTSLTEKELIEDGMIADQLSVIELAKERLVSSESSKYISFNEQVNKILDDYVKKHGNLEHAFIVDTKGIIIADSDRNLIGKDINDRSYVMDALNGKSYFSETLVSKSTGKQIVVISQPIKESGQTIGFVAKAILVESFSNYLKDIKVGDTKSSYAYLLDSKGTMLYHPTKDKIGKPVTNEAIKAVIKRIQKGEQVQQDIVEYVFEGQEKIASYGSLPLSNWLIVVSGDVGEIQEPVSKVRKNAIIISGLSILLSMIVGYIASRQIINPILGLSKVMEEAADGNLTVKAADKSKDELGLLGKSFNRMLTSVNLLIGEINNASQMVASSSEELTASAEQNVAAVEQVSASASELAQGSAKQAKIVQETSITINEMSNGIQQIANSAYAVSVSSDRVVEAAKDGVKESENAVLTIERVRETTEKTSEVIRTLGEESKEIGQIVVVIKQIADQTNLLALNAAIEAARAGEQGRGFAVVADEVRKLAEQSSASAEQIASLISKIQTETNNAVKVMEVGTKEVSEGVIVVNKAGESFKLIVEEINQVVSQVQEVSAASQQMAAGSTAVVKAIEEIESIANQTANSTKEVALNTKEQAASMEEIAGASENLSLLSEDLQKNINKFKFN
ncbi:MAG: putative methyl-accepting chemotaxis protein [Bacillales bacterium]|jgi:methyl-accepting chemotaxis protein|nr:putative methyl-accepting chemotaxis protein [Bacillales bacterium]